MSLAVSSKNKLSYIYSLHIGIFYLYIWLLNMYQKYQLVLCNQCVESFPFIGVAFFLSFNKNIFQSFLKKAYWNSHIRIYIITTYDILEALFEGLDWKNRRVKNFINTDIPQFYCIISVISFRNIKFDYGHMEPE